MLVTRDLKWNQWHVVFYKITLRNMRGKNALKESVPDLELVRLRRAVEMTEGVGEGLALPSGGRNGRGPRVDQPAAEQHGPWLAGGGASVLSLVAELLGLVATRGESVSTPRLCRSPRCLSWQGRC